MVLGGILGEMADSTFVLSMILSVNLLMSLSLGKVFGVPKPLLGFVSLLGWWLGIRF